MQGAEQNLAYDSTFPMQGALQNYVFDSDICVGKQCSYSLHSCNSHVA